jgi:hypothetical protein
MPTIQLFIQLIFGKMLYININVLGKYLYAGLVFFMIAHLCKAEAINSEQKKVSSFFTSELIKYIGSNLYFLPIDSFINYCSINISEVLL